MGRNLGGGNSNIFLFSPLIIGGRWKLIFDLRIFFSDGLKRPKPPTRNPCEVVSYLCDDHPIHQKGLRSHKSCLSCLRATLVKVPMMIGEICWDWRDTAIFGICLLFKQFKKVVCKRNLSGWFFWSFGTDVSVLTCFSVFFLVKHHLTGGRYGHNEAWKDLSLRCTAGDVAVPVWQLRGLSISSWLGLGWWKATGTTTWIFSNRMGSRRVQDTHVTIAAPIPEPMMDPRAPGDVRFLVGEDGDSTIGRFVGEERQHDLPHLPNSRSPVPCCSGPQLEVHEDYQEDLEYESSDSDEAGLGCLGGWVGFGKLDATVGNSRSLHCLSRWDAGGGSPPWCRARHWRWKKKHHLFFLGLSWNAFLVKDKKGQNGWHAKRYLI